MVRAGAICRRSSPAARSDLVSRRTMGIENLLPFLRDITTTTKLSSMSLSDRSVAIDGLSLLHRGVSSCARDLALGLPTNKHISFAMSVVRLFLSHGVRRVYVVVDNRSQPCVLKAWVPPVANRPLYLRTVSRKACSAQRKL